MLQFKSIRYNLNILFKILLIGGFFLFNSNLKSEIVMKDKFVYKVAGVVFTMNDLERYFTSLNDLRCIYPESLLFRVFKKQFDQKKKVFFKKTGPFSSQQKLFFKELIKFGKILVYSRSHDVSVNDSITKYFYLSAQKSKCSVGAFNKDKKFTKVFAEVVRLEVFMRSRFLPSENQGKSTPEDFNKAIISSRNLILSIDEQIEQEVYW